MADEQNGHDDNEQVERPETLVLPLDEDDPELDKPYRKPQRRKKKPKLIHQLAPGSPVRRYSAEQRAEVVAAILGGLSLQQASRQFGVPIGTLQKWWIDNAPKEPDVRRSREEMGQIVYDTVAETLKALAARARLTADQDWLREQSAASIAHMDAVHWDRVIRLLSALRPASIGPEEAQLDLET